MQGLFQDGGEENYDIFYFDEEMQRNLSILTAQKPQQQQIMMQQELQVQPHHQDTNISNNNVESNIIEERDLCVLIEEIRKYPCIWDISSKKHKDKF